MYIGGLRKFSLIDYNDKICAIIFTVGCNFSCPYCHNPELRGLNKGAILIPEEEVLDFLEERKGKLEAVVITGGEPTLQPDLLDFIQKIKAMGYLVKLDSNGSNPQILEEALNKKLVDYIAMDVKAPLEKYQTVVRKPIDTKKIQESINLIMKSGIDYEFRTTIVKSLLSKDEILRIGELIKGAKKYYLQKFIPNKTNDPNFMTETTYTDEEFEELREKISALVEFCGVR
ncbi:MAG: anaerobic ribonucleoside-triphosphate reductase activating protein [Patescibacteria group bacterium]